MLAGIYRLLLPFCVLGVVAGISQPAYFPLRPPAVPLAVRSPYTSAWVTTKDGATLNSASAIFWSGVDLGWEGIVTVDGVSYEYLGVGSDALPALPSLKKATPLTTRYDSQYSNFTFAAGPIEVTASFFSPVIPQEVCRTSIPLSYLITSVRATDNATHDVQLYNDINARWITYATDVKVKWSLHESGITQPVNGSNATITSTTSSSIFSWLLELEEAYTFGEDENFPQWGNFTFSTTAGNASTEFTFESGFAADVRYGYVQNRSLTNLVDGDYRASAVREPVFAFAHDLGAVKRESSVVYTLGSVQQPSVRYLNADGLSELDPWWMKCYGSSLYELIEVHYRDLATSQELAARWETQLRADIARFYRENSSSSSLSSGWFGDLSASWMYSNSSEGTNRFGEEWVFDSRNGYGFYNPSTFAGVAVPDVDEAHSYYSIVALAARQVMGAYVLTARQDSDSSSSNTTAEPFMFQKEISSDGNVNTVDVLYPAMPFFLYANPAMIRYTLDPLYENQEDGFYPNGYSMHDLGSAFPNATGHVLGDDEYMPLEESGNMILMTLAYARFANDTAYLRDHYEKMAEWAQYLLEFALIPEDQLSTDDFAGELVNQTNLAIKGIVAIGAMGEIAKAVGASSEAANFSATATSYETQWETFAIDPSVNHTMLAYEWRSSWGLLYNIYPDRLLSLGIIPDHVYEMQSAWYPGVSQVFGVPLDVRHFYTKSDWQLWTAATCEPATRRLFVDAVAFWLNATSTQYAFTDLYDTVGTGEYPTDDDGDITQFIARPVQGGEYSLLALLK
ncbi:hypothetical protein ASPZODRAFT_149605 [Penicilliopsis zonata CBS 506.65]|uniref:Glutaminase n=1 Tax=Penicilliopsis zonata CBS 506.65 TaxID=1073090 RepID=A0A1L9SSZ7_9EURO|nr:hypothetical protein ASPZODRAFT_149605 [Penicilliopsis zonata CBS 506.65]OJJ50227.1 hypothetical protein ASPZODRAFT_149605 [Penicilliopsis zonata CBS 506.65]